MTMKFGWIWMKLRITSFKIASSPSPTADFLHLSNWRKSTLPGLKLYDSARWDFRSCALRSSFWFPLGGWALSAKASLLALRWHCFSSGSSIPSGEQFQGWDLPHHLSWLQVRVRLPVLDWYERTTSRLKHGGALSGLWDYSNGWGNSTAGPWWESCYFSGFVRLLHPRGVVAPWWGSETPVLFRSTGDLSNRCVSGSFNLQTPYDCPTLASETT